MKTFLVRWTEQHSVELSAEDENHARELIEEIPHDKSFCDMDDMDIEELGDDPDDDGGR